MPNPVLHKGHIKYPVPCSFKAPSKIRLQTMSHLTYAHYVLYYWHSNFFLLQTNKLKPDILLAIGTSEDDLYCFGILKQVITEWWS